MKVNKQEPNSNSRREFVKKGAVAAAAFSIVPRHVLGKGFAAPSDTLYIATIGAGGKGTSDTQGFSKKWDEATKSFVINPNAKQAFLCDVDQVKGAQTFKAFPDAKIYVDWREMLDKEAKHIDAVSVSTPDHTHAVAASAAIQLGKHIWTQKPMTHDIFEARTLAMLVKKHKVVSQMGNQGSSGDGVRQMREWYDAGLLGDVTDVYCYTNRPVWPQGGMKWPTATGTPPSTFNWDLWQSTAKAKPFPAGRTGQADPQRGTPEAAAFAALSNDDRFTVAPFAWRGWWDYGTGVIGDMGAHILEAPMTILNLGFVKAVQTSLGNPSRAEEQSLFADNCPPSSNTILTFPNPKGDSFPNIRIHWMDGGLLPPRPEEMGDFETLRLSDGSGMLFIGSKGKMIAGCYAASPKLLPASRMDDEAIKAIPIKYPRVKGGEAGHYAQWVEACLSGGKMETSSPFSKAAMVVENMLVANLAIRGYNVTREPAVAVASVAPVIPAPAAAGTPGAPGAARGGRGGGGGFSRGPIFPARNITLRWDHAQMKITNVDEVNQYVKREYREGWHLSGI